uniref:Uncharacterized protein n=1 Tax=Steinernema glaseri TaxID=37863 RepID=A0A1I8AKH9_9BILA
MDEINAKLSRSCSSPKVYTRAPIYGRHQRSEVRIEGSKRILGWTTSLEISWCHYLIEMNKSKTMCQIAKVVSSFDKEIYLGKLWSEGSAHGFRTSESLLTARSTRMRIEGMELGGSYPPGDQLSSKGLLIPIELHPSSDLVPSRQSTIPEDDGFHSLASPNLLDIDCVADNPEGAYGKWRFIA